MTSRWRFSLAAILLAMAMFAITMQRMNSVTTSLLGVSASLRFTQPAK